MTVFRELTITWKGKDYKIVPSMKLMRSIETGEISFTDIAVRTSQGRPPISHIALVLSKMLQSVGCNVDDEQIYLNIVNGSQENATALISVVLMAFSPTETDSKNSEAQTESQP